jgi:hypothetical protein
VLEPWPAGAQRPAHHAQVLYSISGVHFRL